jgi:magnesium transporter
MLATYAGEHSVENSHESEELSRVGASTGVKLPSREKLSEIENSSRVSELDGVLFLSMPFVTSAHAIDDPPAPIGFVLSDKVLVTLRFAELHSFDAVTASLKEGKKITTSSDVFACLMDQMVDTSSDLLEKIGSELDALSRGIFPSIKGRRHKLKSNAAFRGILSTSATRESDFLTFAQASLDFSASSRLLFPKSARGLDLRL